MLEVIHKGESLKSCEQAQSESNLLWDEFGLILSRHKSSGSNLWSLSDKCTERRTNFSGLGMRGLECTGIVLASTAVQGQRFEHFAKLIFIAVDLKTMHNCKNDYSF